MQQSMQRTPYSLTGLNPYPWIRWWYTMAAPAAPDNAENLPLHDREFLRKGKLTSLAMLIEILLMLIAVVPAVATSPSSQAGHLNVNLIIIILLPVVFTAISAFFNRAGKLLFASVLVIISLEVIETVSGVAGLTSNLGVMELLLIFILIHPLMISALLLPAWGILMVAGVNVVVAALLVYIPFFPRAPELVSFMQRGGRVPLFALPAITLLLCALICFIVITSLQESLKRADKAEEIAKLHEIVTKQASQELQAKRQLEGDVREIIAGMTRFANGDNEARIQLEPGCSLWSVASSINNMVGRFVRLREQEQPMQQSFMALKAYMAATQLAKARGVPVILPRTGTEIDTLIEELLTHAQGVQRTPHYRPTQVFENY
ncbi:MAG TPA: hypothetical protein VFV38_07200 [Ktedonobacteraceae bacterium]|nr:hypothetical protein [Ktedonobacteraceae bacterium]